MNPLLIAAAGAKAGGNILGGVSDYFGNQAQRDRALNAIRAQKQGEENAYGIGSKYYSDLEGAYAPEAGTYMTDLAGWRDANSKAPLEMGQFDDSKYTTDAYLDPSMAFQQEQAANAINQSAAARGGMFSGTGATAKALQDRSTQLAQTDWGNAFSRMSQDKQFGYTDFINHFKSQTDAEAERIDRLGNMVNQSGTARQNMFDARGGQADLGMGHERTMGDLEANRQNTFGNYWKAQSGVVGNSLRGLGDAGASLIPKFGGK